MLEGDIKRKLEKENTFVNELDNLCSIVVENALIQMMNLENTIFLKKQRENKKTGYMYDTEKQLTEQEVRLFNRAQKV